jgi:hypothetical protein
VNCDNHEEDNNDDDDDYNFSVLLGLAIEEYQ